MTKNLLLVNKCKLLENLEHYKFLLTEGEQVKLEYKNDISMFIVTDQKLIFINKNARFNYISDYTVLLLNKINGYILQVDDNNTCYTVDFIVPGIEFNMQIALTSKKENIEELIKFLNNKIN